MSKPELLGTNCEQVLDETGKKKIKLSSLGASCKFNGIAL